MRLELTIKPDYLPSWGLWEGVRELIQNARDAEVQHLAPMRVTHSGSKLAIETSGVDLSHEALLLGSTSKAGRADMIGHFGEGMKLGILALVRAGHRVKVETAGEVWTPKIDRSERFVADVLVFEIKKARDEQIGSRVAITISGITAAQWAEMRARFLFLAKVPPSDRLDSPHGTVLLSPAYKGRLFVKGIFVSSVPQLSCGYDLADAETDRDRRLVAAWEMNQQIARVWNGCDPAQAAERMLELAGDAQSKDLEGLHAWRADEVHEEVRALAVRRFRERYGEDAHPIESTTEGETLGHVGVRGVVVPAALRNILQHDMGTVSDVTKRLTGQIVKVYAIDELEEGERDAFTFARGLLEAAGAEREVSVVDYRDKRLEGLHEGGKVSIARATLRSGVATLKVLIHEIAHDEGGDGSRQHVAAIERLWSDVFQLRAAR